MNGVVDRLRKSKVEHVGELESQGVAAGSEWAKGTAEFAELKRLGSWWEGTRHSERELYLTTIEGNAYGSGHSLAALITGDEHLHRSEGDQFWDFVSGDGDQRRYEDDFVRGFARGAVEVWDTVKDQI